MSPSKRAVIIGINSYSDNAITPLQGAVNDATELHNRLTTSGGFIVDDEHYLIDGQATTARIRQAVSDLLWKAEELDLALFYFSGHGITDGYGNGFIAPYDMIRGHPLVYGISMLELKDLMLAAKNKQTIILIFDCCYSGIAASGEKAVSDDSEAALDHCLGPVAETSGSGRIVYTSGGSDERSREASTVKHRYGSDPPHAHGAFTFELIEGLDGRATSQGRVTLDSLIKFVNSSFAQKMTNPKPRLYSSSATSLDEVILCIPKRQEEVAGRLEQVKRLLSPTESADSTSAVNPIDLFRAADFLGKILAESPGLEEALEVRSDIDRQFARLKQEAQLVLFENYFQLIDGCQETFDQLDNAVRRINFDTFMSLDGGFRIVTLLVFRVAAKQIELNVLQRNLTSYHNRSRTMPRMDRLDRPTIAVGAPDGGPGVG
jgi:hypothetical protein